MYRARQAACSAMTTVTGAPVAAERNERVCRQVCAARRCLRPALTPRARAAPGNGITFKTTLKGMSKLNNAALGDLWIPVASLIALGVALGIGCRDLVPPPPLHSANPPLPTLQM